MSKRFVSAQSWVAPVWVALGSIAMLGGLACATGSDTDDGGEGGAGAVTGTTTGATMSGSTSSSSTTGGGGNATTSSTGSGTCAAPMHMCGATCEGNTPETGCYQSTNCAECPLAQNATAQCAQDGTCELVCDSPYELLGASCICPSARECCKDAECSGGGTCDGSGVCQGGCDEDACIFTCFAQMALGSCQGGMCVCTPF